MPERTETEDGFEMMFQVNPDEAEAKNGKVFKERADHPLSDYWKDPETAARLGSITEGLLQGTTHGSLE